MRKLVAMVLAAALTGAAGGSIGVGRAEAGTTGLGVTLVGDSVMAAFNYVPSAQTTISSGYAMNLDAKVCRRLVAPSCSYQGVAPPTARQVIQADAAHLGDVVVMNVGYNDSWTTYRAQIDQIMQAIAGHGVSFVLWVTLRQSGPNAGGYANINAAIRSAAATYPQLRIADWNAYSAGQSSWFSDADGLHLTAAGAMAMATLIRSRLDALLPCQPKLATGAPAPPLATLPPSPPASGQRMVTIAPQRLVDTRPGLPDDGVTTRLGAGRVLTVTVAGRPPVPANALGAIVNLTMVTPCAPGYAVVYPAGAAHRPLASNANFTTGQVVAGLAVIPLGAGGAVSIYTTVQTDVIVDLVGYVVASTGSLYNPVAPFRVYDSRSTKVPIAAGHQVAIAVRGAGHGTIPASTGVTGAVLNLTVTSPAAPGYLTLYPGPCLSTPPRVSNVNYATGQTIANLAETALGANGTVCVYTSATANVIVDAAGWLGATGSGWFGVAPQRLVDTRAGTASHPTIKGRLVPRRPLTVALATNPGVPTGATAAMVNLTVVHPSAPGYLTAYPGPCTATPPVVSNVNYVANDVRPNLAAVRIGPGSQICLVSLASLDVVIDLQGWFG